MAIDKEALRKLGEKLKPKPKETPVAKNVVYEARADAGRDAKQKKPPKIRVEFQQQKADSPIAKAFSGIELSDQAAAVVKDFMETRPPDRQLKADLGLRLAEDIYAGYKTGAISSATEAIKAMSVVRAIYGGVDRSQLAEFNGYLEKIIAKGEVGREGIEETVKMLGQAAARKDIDLTRGLEAVVDIGKSYNAAATETVGDLKGLYQGAVEVPVLTANQVYAGEADKQQDRAQELDDYLTELRDRYDIDQQVLEEYSDVVVEARTRKDVARIAQRLQRATSALHDQLPQDGKADEAFLNTQVATLKELSPLSVVKIDRLTQALRANPPDWTEIRSARADLEKFLPKNDLVKIPSFVLNAQAQTLLLRADEMHLHREFVGQVLKEKPDAAKLKAVNRKLETALGGREGPAGNREMIVSRAHAAEVMNIGQQVDPKRNRELSHDYGLTFAEGGAPTVDFYDPASPGPASTQKVKDALQSIQDTFNNHPQYAGDYDYIRMMREDLLKRYPNREVSPYITKLEGMENTARTAYQAAQEAYRASREPFSSLYLTDSEREGLKIHPEWEIERFLRRVEETTVLFPDTPAARAASQRLQIISDYITHDSFMRDIRAYANTAPNLNTQDLRDRYIHRMESIYLKVSEKISTRTKGMEAYGYFKGTGDPDKLGDSLIAFGVRGAQYLLGENHGFVQVAYDRFNLALEDAIRDPKTGERRRIEGRVLEEARVRAKRDLMRDKDLYSDMLNAAFPGRKDSDGVLIQGVTEGDVDAALKLGEFVSLLTQREAFAMNKGLGPGEKSRYSNINSFATADTTEMILMAWDPKRWFFEKWHNLDEGKRVMWDNISYFSALSHKRKPDVQGRVASVRKGSQEWKDLVIEAFGFSGVDGHGQKTINEGEVEQFLKRESKRKALSWGEPHAKDHKYSNLLTNADLERALMVKEGGEIAGRMIHMYDYFSSGWRGDTYLDQLNEIWGNAGNGGYSESMGLGIRLKKAGDALYKAESKEARESSTKGLMKTLDKVAKYRPQALLQYLHDGGDVDIKQWVTNQSQLLGRLEGPLNNGRDPSLTRLKLERPDQVYSFVMQRYLTINSLLAEKGLGYIDYSVGPSANQVEIVRDGTRTGVFTSQKAVVDQALVGFGANDVQDFVTLMKEMASYTGKEDVRAKLTQNKYYHLYERTQWVDDLRLRYMEDPDNAPGARILTADEREHKARVAVSQIFNDLGQSRGDPLVRVWKDTKKGVDAVIALYNGLSPKKDDYLKAMQIIYPNIKDYSGSEPIAGRAIIEIMTGVGMTYKSEDLLNFFLMGDLPRGSQLKRLYGSLADSYSPNELWHFLEEHNIELSTELQSLAPDLYKEAMKHLNIMKEIPGTGITFKGGLYADRLKLFVMISALIVATGVATTALGTLKEEFKE